MVYTNETRAEYRFLRQIGADTVGMSTVAEAVAASRCGLRTLALSLVTNVARPDCPEVVRAEDILRAAERAEPNVRKIIAQVMAHPASASFFPGCLQQRLAGRYLSPAGTVVEARVKSIS